MTDESVRPELLAKAEKKDLFCYPTVSVIIISYNHGPFLLDAIESVQSQSYPKVEIIVVDNDSSDGSQLKLQAYAATHTKRQLRVILSNKNEYLTGAMLKGFKASSGSFVVFLDGDDCLLARCLEAHIRTQLYSRFAVGLTAVDMYQSSGLEIVCSTTNGFAKFVSSGQGCRPNSLRIAQHNFTGNAFKNNENWPTASQVHYVDRTLVMDWVWSATSALCFRRDAVDLMFCFPPKIKAGTDNYLARGISALTGSMLVDLPLAVYRIHGNNMFTKAPALAGFIGNSREEMNNSDAEVSIAIIQCYLNQAHLLAATLAEEDYYIEAIFRVAATDKNIGRKGARRFVSNFLSANQQALLKEFGAETFSRWKRRFSYFSKALPV